MTGKKRFALIIVFFGLILLTYSLWRANSSSNEYWEQSSNSTVVVDHSPWQNILDDYLIVDDPRGINLFDYAGFLDDSNSELGEYIANLSKIDPAELSRSEQMAFWINLYNALTVQVIIKSYPISSIKDLGRFGLGPWDDLAIVIQGLDLTLNDIEHEILRPIWGDFRIHFAVNCASIGCPNLLPQAFTAANTETLLNRGAREYLSHPRGLQFGDGELRLSSIFDWYRTDFASSEQQLLVVLSQFLPPDEARRVSDYRGDVSYDYDWQLNEE